MSTTQKITSELFKSCPLDSAASLMSEGNAECVNNFEALTIRN